MSFLNNKSKKKLFISISSIVLTLVIIVTACAIYLGDYYHADKKAIATFSPLESIQVVTISHREF